MTSTKSDSHAVATAVASGSLGTGTAVDDETTLMAVPEAPEALEAPAASQAPAVAEVPPAPTPSAQPAPAPSARVASGRRDPYRPIGIALAAVLVTLAGVAILSSGGSTPAQIGVPPAATEASSTNAEGAQVEDDDNGNGNGNGNGHGNGNGNGGGRGHD